MIGKLGDLTFSVSEREIFTFSDMDFTMGAKWSEIPRVSYKPLLEYSGRELRTFSFKITLLTGMNLNVNKKLKLLRKMAEGKKAYTLIIGEDRIGKSQWVIKGISGDIEHVLNNGVIVGAVVKIEIMEYIEKKKLPLIFKKKPKMTQSTIKKPVRKKLNRNRVRKKMG